MYANNSNITEIVLSLEGVSKGVGDLRIIESIDLQLRYGETVALCGASGSGKTTLLQIAGLLIKPDSGKVIVAQQDCTSPSVDKAAIRKMLLGYVYQFHHLIENLSVLQNVAIPGMIRSLSWKQAVAISIEILHKLHIQDLAQKNVRLLSGGEKQRVAIARALAFSPAVIIADEPTGNLDPNNAQIVFNLLIQAAKEKNSAVLVATHNQSLMKMTDRWLRLVDGKLQQEC